MVKIIGLSGLAGSGKDYIANILCTNYGFVKVAFADPIKRICRDVFDFTEEQLWGPSEKRNEPDNRYRKNCNFCARTGSVRVPDEDKNGEWNKETEWTGSFVTLPCRYCEGAGYTNLTARHALQRLGTEWGRDCYENVWVDYTLRISFALLREPDAMGQIDCYDPKKGLYVQKAPVFVINHFGRMERQSHKGVVIPDVRFRNELDALHGGGAKVVRIRRNSQTTLTGEAAQHASERDQAGIPDSDFDFVLHNVENSEVLQKSIQEMMNTI